MNIAIEIAFSFKHELDDDYRNVEIEDGASVLEAFQRLGERYPVFRERVFDERSRIRRNINALINGSNVQFREGFDTVLKDGDRLSVLPPVGGG